MDADIDYPPYLKRYIAIKTEKIERILEENEDEIRKCIKIIFGRVTGIPYLGYVIEYINILLQEGLSSKEMKMIIKSAKKYDLFYPGCVEDTDEYTFAVYQLLSIKNEMKKWNSELLNG
jgi:hypothetical protein